MRERPVLIARTPALQGQVDAIQGFLRQRDWTANRLCREVYGRDEYGKARGAGTMSPIVKGERWVGERLAERIKQAVGLDLTAFAKPYGEAVPRHPRTQAADVLLAYEDHHGTLEPPDRSAPPSPRPRLLPPPAGNQPRLALSIGTDGRGSLSFNMLDAPAAEILRAFSVLQAAGLAIDPLEQEEL